MNTLYAASTCPQDQRERLAKRAQGECLRQRALPQAHPSRRAWSPHEAHVVALGLSLSMSLGLLQAVTWGMGQRSGGVSLAQHLQQPRPALQLSQAASAPVAVAPLAAPGHGV